MAYQRVTLSQLKSRLAERVGGESRFWTEAEQENAINEALATWQLITGDFLLSETERLEAETSLLELTLSKDPASLLRVSCTDPTVGRVSAAKAGATGAVLTPSLASHLPGGMFWCGDEWVFKEGNYSASAGAMALNMIEDFVGPGAKSIALASASLYGDTFKAALETAGHTVTRDTTIGDGSPYNFIFCEHTEGNWTGATNNAKCETMWTFIQNGGGLYNGMGTNTSEGTVMSVLLAHCGIGYSDTYVWGGNVDVTVVGLSDPIFTGVTTIKVNGSGQLTLTGTPTSGTASRWECSRLGSNYYILAAWRPQ